MNIGQKLYKEAKKVIPGGTQLLSKRPEMFLPDGWPSYYEEATGCVIKDLDGNSYKDMITMGIGTCILGYADPDVNEAIIDVVKRGNMSSLNAPEEVELAKLLCKIHPWADMARFCRTGGEAMAMAVRIGRAKSKKDKVLFCGYHGWHNWYLSANLSEDGALDGHLLPGLDPAGVPRALKGCSLPFKYNDTEGFLKLVNENSDAGVIVLETIRNEEPNKDFIETISRIAKEKSIVFIVDEITSGWRLNLGGAHLLYGIEPDIAVFAKGISNGIPMAAVIGKKDVMEAAQNSFISSTYWTDKMGPAAALVTIKKMKDLNVSEHLIKIGKKVQAGWMNLGVNNDIKISTSGIYPLSHFSFEHEDALTLKTLYTQFMLEKGFLASTVLYSSFAHKEDDVDSYLKATDEVFKKLSFHLNNNTIYSLLKGDVCHSGFKRLN